MFNFPLEKYRFYYATKNNGELYQVIAVSTYEGRMVKGVAKCDPSDKFDLEKGKQLAAARCNAKVAAKRMKRADKELNKARKTFIEAEGRLDAMNEYFVDAKIAKRNAEMEIKKILKNM